MKQYEVSVIACNKQGNGDGEVYGTFPTLEEARAKLAELMEDDSLKKDWVSKVHHIELVITEVEFDEDGDEVNAEVVDGDEIEL